MKPRLGRRGVSKRTAIIFATSLLIIVCAVIVLKFGVISAANRSAEASLETTQSQMISLTSRMNTTLSASSVSNDQKMARLKQYVTDVKNMSDSVCSTQRAAVYYDTLRLHTTCESVRRALQDVTAAASAQYSYISDETILAALLPKVTMAASFSDSYDLWTRTAALVNAAKVGQEANTIKLSLQKAVEGYRDAWKALVDADNKQDSTTFTDASTTVKAAYVTLQSQADVSKAQLQALGDVFSAKYAVFKAAIQSE